jgi:hypothetical protein
MAGLNNALPNPPSKPDPPKWCHPLCPICTGWLIYLSGSFRCARCSFTICDDCDGGTGAPTTCTMDY